GTKWLFDIDTLTMSMNYQLVVAGYQPNDNAGIKENLDAGKVGKETVSAQQYVLLPLWSSDSQDPKNTDDNVAADAFEVKENENDVHVSSHESDKIDKKKNDEKAKRDDKGKSLIDSITGVWDLRAEFEKISFNSTNRLGTKWLFDIDTLTMSMNYQLVVAGYQPNDNASIKENLDAGKVGKETVSAQQYVLLPLWSSDSQDPKNTDDNVAADAFEVKENENDVHVSSHESDKIDKKKNDEKAKRDDKGNSLIDSITGVWDLRAEFEKISFNSTNRFNAISEPVNAAGPNLTNSTNSFNTASPFVNAEDIVYSDDKEDVGVEADLSNLETNIPVSPISTTRVHKDHYVNQIIVVTEVIIRRDLHLDDADRVECLPTAEIFEELARMIYEKPPPKLTFYKAFFSEQWKFLIQTIAQCISAKRAAWNEFSSSMASAVICLATGRNFNFSKYIFNSMVRNVDSQSVETPLFDSMLVQSQQQAEEDKVAELEKDKNSQALEILQLKKREDASKHEGKIASIDADEGITLVDVETIEEEVTLDAESQERTNLKDVNAASKGVSVVSAPELVSCTEPTLFDDEDVTMTMAQTLINLKAEKARILDEKIAQKLHDE
nr:hypothetical protein [Tanacetum cinerariifolium]